ncbi:hypothetical protein [Duganella violaceipulchra]|uniref:Glycosyltransferase n=1 Tax=Duganella violaceipulchra TaxID=2849652 RepID=A0AA41L0V2_9BURK|nr:hypothetical protein [Duganella violaceicalia]MBV6319528.1 hypothetical protein [Duganella violaceicalia]MCP2006659.1 hypothetical protein [Duganella violaceicalia]
MCCSDEANQAGAALDNQPVVAVEVECRQPDERAPQARVAPVPAPVSEQLAVPADFATLVVVGYSEGSGEVTAGLNVLPFLPQGTHVVYGQQTDASAEIKLRGWAQIRKMSGLPDEPAPPDDPPWHWIHNGKHFWPRHWKIRPGTKPLLVLAPHGYNGRELELSVAAAPGSVLVSWAPFGYTNGDFGFAGDHGVKLGVVGGTGYLGPNAMNEVTAPRSYTADLYSVVPAPPVFDPLQAATRGQRFAAAAVALSQEPNNRLACVYGHGTNAAGPATVLRNLLKAARAGTDEGRWAIIFVIHHQPDDTPDRRLLSRPGDIATAIGQLPDTQWVHTVFEEDQGFRMASCAALRIKIYHTVGLEKTCMDGLFVQADLAIVEGANSVVQLMCAGRPFLRASSGVEFLGQATDYIERRERAVHGAALDTLRRGSAYLSRENADTLVGQRAVRALLFTYADRAPLDALATHLAVRYFTPEMNPLTLTGNYLEGMHPALGVGEPEPTFDEPV